MYDQIPDPLGPFSLDEVCRRTGAHLLDKNDGSKIVADVASLSEAQVNHLSFLENRKYFSDFLRTNAKAVIVHSNAKNTAPAGIALLISPNPHKSFALAAQMFHPSSPPDPGISGDAWLHADCTIGQGTEIQAGARIFAGVNIGGNTFIGANTIVGKGVTIGTNCYLASNVTVTDCRIGNGVKIHPGARIGQPGFGFAMDKNGHTFVPQLGKVVIGNNVRVGANTTIDRGALRDTIIGDGCMIDNLVQIAHNVQLGRNCVIVGQSGVAGSSTLGNFVVVGGQTAIAGHLIVGDGVTIAGKSGVTHDLSKAGVYGGIPAVPIKQWRRQVGILANMVKRGLRRNTDE